MSKTGIDWTDTATNINLEEALYFYTRNDYLIVNNLLEGNIDLIWEVAGLVIGDNIGVLKEHYAGERPPFDDKTVAWLKGRIWEEINEEAKTEILRIAKNDIANILGAMKPTQNKILVYRTVMADAGARRASATELTHSINDVIDFKYISSTSISPGWQESAGHEFYRYEITVPENGLVLELDYLHHNEKGEVLLPPMKCKVTNVRGSDNEKCRGIIELEYLGPIPVVGTGPSFNLFAQQ